MIPIINMNFDSPDNVDHALDSAIQRLGEYLDQEIETLHRVLSLTGRGGVSDHFEALAQLHLPPTKSDNLLREFLQEACFHLEILHLSLCALPARAVFAAAYGRSDFNAMVRWSTARLTDIITTLRSTIGA